MLTKKVFNRAMQMAEDLGEARHEIDQLRAEIVRLREALKPFAAQTRASGPTEEANIRRARAALKERNE